MRGLKVRFVHNPDYALGLSTSLKRGLQALDPGLDGVLVLPGRHAADHGRPSDRLIGAFNPIEGRGIVVPTLPRQARQPGAVGTQLLPGDA